MSLRKESHATIAGNTLRRVGAATGNSPLRAAVLALALATTRLRVYESIRGQSAPRRQTA